MTDPKMPQHLANALLEARKKMGAATTAPEVAHLHRQIREHGYKRDTSEPKPWKKPWDA